MSAPCRKRTLFDVMLEEVCRRYAPGSRSLRPYLVTSPLNQPPASQKQPIHSPLIQMPLRVRSHPKADVTNASALSRASSEPLVCQPTVGH